MWVENCAQLDVADVYVPNTGGVPQPLPWYTPPDAPFPRVPHTQPRPCASLEVTWEGQRLATVEVEIATTQLHYGGVRRWFVCPVCRRRAKKLYANPAWEPFGRPPSIRLGCRRCLALVYECQYRKRPRWNWLW